MRPSLAVPALAALSTALLLTATAGPSVAAPTALAPAAPYMELSAPNGGNLQAAIDAGLTHVTAAFVVGKKCTPIWDNGVPVKKDKESAAAVTGAQSQGVDVIISFGGAGGTELARSCTNLTKLTAAYQAVIDRFGITAMDFDVEGTSIQPRKEKDSIARRFAAIKALEQHNPGLSVSVTVPVGQSGLVRSGVTFLKSAKASGATIDIVNIMTMDYGGSVNDMGAAAISAAKGTLRQMQALWPSDTYANVGITPMIGDNDSTGETFSLTNAQDLVAFAAANSVGRLAFWSINRDQACSDTLFRARNNCSGVNQSPLEFTKTLLGGS